MDLYSHNSNSSKKSNNSSTSSNYNHNNAHHNSHSPNIINAADGSVGSVVSVGSLDADTYNLQYCSSSSSVSAAEPHIYENLILSATSESSNAANSPPAYYLSKLYDAAAVYAKHCASSTQHDAAHKHSIVTTRPPVKCSSSTYMDNEKVPPRKRKLEQYTQTHHAGDPELDFEPPLAKRQQTTASVAATASTLTAKKAFESDSITSSLYSSAPTVYTIMSSSVYTSPVDEIDTQSTTSSPCSLHCQHHHHHANAVTEAEDDDDDNENLTDDDDDEADEYSEEDEIVSNTTSSTVSPAECSKQRHIHISNNNNNNKCNTTTENAEQRVISSDAITSATTVTLPQHHGERTPGANSYTTQPANVLSKVNAYDEFLTRVDAATEAQYADCMTPATEPETIRLCPLPALSWANAHDVWQLMCKKDEEAACLRSANMLEQHPGLQPRMRAILLDWLIEVCEVYKLHRETYYLAVDYLDRYLSVQEKVQKTHLQLIGITCLFVAAKVEEIYPPKIGEFAYVTDGACQEADILQHEILLLQALEWNISPVTPMGWLGVYMQLNVNNRTPASLNNVAKNAASVRHRKKQQQQQQHNGAKAKLDGSAAEAYAAAYAGEVDDAFIYPQFSGFEFVQTAQLLDLCSMDLGIANYPYSVIAAAAMSHTFNRETALRCSGLDWETIAPCALWMEPFFHVVCEEAQHLHMMEQNEQINSKCGLGHVCPNIVTDDSHIIQTHTVTMEMFERAWLLQEQYHHTLAAKIKQEASPATGLKCPEGLLTPPASDRKPLNTVREEDEPATVTVTVNCENIAAKTKAKTINISAAVAEGANSGSSSD